MGNSYIQGNSWYRCVNSEKVGDENMKGKTKEDERNGVGSSFDSSTLMLIIHCSKPTNFNTYISVETEIKRKLCLFFNFFKLNNHRQS